jgi:hypothetical protein
MALNNRVAKRVGLDHTIDAVAMAVDGTWSVKGRLEDISATGARFHFFDRVNDRMRSEEFFLFMTPDGKVRRRSKLIWERKGRIGIKFSAASD